MKMTINFEFQNWDESEPHRVMEFWELTSGNLKNFSNPEKLSNNFRQVFVIWEFQNWEGDGPYGVIELQDHVFLEFWLWDACGKT